MSDPLFDAIRKKVHAGGAFVLTSTSIAIDAAEAAYEIKCDALEMACSLGKNAQLRARIAELEDEVFRLSYIKEVDDR